MSRTRNHFASLFAIVAMALPAVMVGSGDARADVSIHVSGHVSGKVRVGHRHRPRRRARARRAHAHIHVGGAVYVGGFSTPPPPPPCDCGPGHVPAYYTEPPPAPAPLPPPVATVAASAASEPALPRLGIGVFAGTVKVEDRAEGQEQGIVGRLRLTDRWLIEAELAKTEMESARIDRRVGGALLYDLSPRSRWSAHLLAGLGMTYIDVDQGSWQAQQEYGELGAGLTWRLTPKLHLAGDLRVGSRRAVDGAPTDLALKSIAPAAGEDEAFSRARVSAVLSF